MNKVHSLYIKVKMTLDHQGINVSLCLYCLYVVINVFTVNEYYITT